MTNSVYVKGFTHLECSVCARLCFCFSVNVSVKGRNYVRFSKHSTLLRTQSIHAEPSFHFPVSFLIFSYYFKPLMSLIKSHLIQMNLFPVQGLCGVWQGKWDTFLSNAIEALFFSLIMFNSLSFNT